MQFYERIPTFWRNMLVSSSGLKCIASVIGLVIWGSYKEGGYETQGEHFKPEDGGSIFLR
jgi:hypothetical protein